MLWQIWFFFHLGLGVLKHSSVLFVFLTSLISDGNSPTGWVITFVFVFVYLTSLLMARRLVRQEASWAPYNDARWRLWDKVLSRIYLYFFCTYLYVNLYLYLYVNLYLYLYVNLYLYCTTQAHILIGCAFIKPPIKVTQNLTYLIFWRPGDPLGSNGTPKMPRGYPGGPL